MSVLEEIFEEIKKLKRDNKDLRNELCMLCGKYTEAHNGACDDCRWKEVEER